MQEEFTHKGRKFTIEAFPIGDTGKWGCAIYPHGQLRGIALFEPDAVYKHGKLVDFLAPHEAISAGKSYVIGDLLRD